MYLQPTMTAARAAWLEKLSHGPADRGRGTVVPFQCMKLGWTEWHYVERETGLPLTEAEALKRWGRGSWYPHVKLAGERLTPAGWTVLNQWRQNQAMLCEARKA